MTLEQLMALLAELTVKMEASMKLVNTGANAEENNKFTSDLNAIVVEMEDVKSQVEEKKAELDAGEDALARAKAFSTPNIPKTRQAGDLTGVKVGKDNIMDDPKLGFKSLGDCAIAAYKAAKGTYIDPRLAVIGSGNPAIEAAGLRQGNGPEGGFIVPPAFSTALLNAGNVVSLDLYNQTTNFTLEGNESISLPSINETSRKDGSRWGGTRAFWAEEEATMTESEPKFREITIRPKELHILTKASNKLLNNSPIALGQMLNMIAADEIAFVRSDAVVNGDGVGKPKGYMKSAALVSVAKEVGQSADTVVLENTTKMLARMTLRWKSGASWYINKDVLGQLQLMKVGDTPVFMPAGGVSGLPFSTLHGLPIVETEYNEVLGDKGDIALVNLRAYVTAQNGATRADSSIHFHFDTNRTAFRWVVEADGQTWAQQPVTDFKGTGTTSPYVTLDARA